MFIYVQTYTKWTIIYIHIYIHTYTHKTIKGHPKPLVGCKYIYIKKKTHRGFIKRLTQLHCQKKNV